MKRNPLAGVVGLFSKLRANPRKSLTGIVAAVVFGYLSINGVPAPVAASLGLKAGDMAGEIIGAGDVQP